MMTTAIDTNVIAALWDERREIHMPARRALDHADEHGQMVMSGSVYAELVAAPERSAAMVDAFLDETGITVEWETGEAVWRGAAIAFRGYVARRRKSHGTLPRRILADFIIGAHAESHGYALLTLDQRLYQASFPNLRVIGL